MTYMDNAISTANVLFHKLRTTSSEWVNKNELEKLDEIFSRKPVFKYKRLQYELYVISCLLISDHTSVEFDEALAVYLIIFSKLLIKTPKRFLLSLKRSNAGIELEALSVFMSSVFDRTLQYKINGDDIICCI